MTPGSTRPQRITRGRSISKPVRASSSTAPSPARPRSIAVLVAPRREELVPRRGQHPTEDSGPEHDAGEDVADHRGLADRAGRATGEPRGARITVSCARRCVTSAAVDTGDRALTTTPSVSSSAASRRLCGAKYSRERPPPSAAGNHGSIGVAVQLRVPGAGAGGRPRNSTRGR